MCDVFRSFHVVPSFLTLTSTNDTKIKNALSSSMLGTLSNDISSDQQDENFSSGYGSDSLLARNASGWSSGRFADPH
jgi:hypothetical protein